MEFNFVEALRSLRPGAAFQVANQARPPGRYLFAAILPERGDYSYDAQAGSMTVRTTMAGLAGMDSPYPEGGVVQTTEFSEQTCKLANRVRLSEKALRSMQAFLMRLQLTRQPTVPFIQQEALNFTDKLIVQAHLDAAEWLRGQALSTGGIDWTFNQKRLLVDYGIPTANKVTARTGNDGYGGSTSKFWADIRKARQLLKNNVKAFIAHPDTLDMIRYNGANSMVVQSGSTQSGQQVTFRRTVATTDGSQIKFLSDDSDDIVTFISYGDEGEVIDPANPGQTLKVPFMPKGKIVAVANNSGTSYVVGAGSTPPPEFALGYTHLAPTIEGGGVPGRWADVYTPEQEPWAIEGRGVSNILPVIEAPDKIVILTTDMV